MKSDQMRRILAAAIEDAEMVNHSTATALERLDCLDAAQGVRSAFDRLRSDLFLIHNASQ